MKKLFLTLSMLLAFCIASMAQTQVTFYTNYGSFQAEMYDSLAPITSGNFINLVNNKRYDGKAFYRVVNNFVVQGGLWPDTSATIPDEFDSTGTLTNKKMTLSMANSGPNTGSCEFFINLKNNFFLDYDKAPLTSAHPIFGIVRNGWVIVDSIGKVAVDGNDQPLSPVVMDSLRVTGSFLSQDEIEDNKFLSSVYPNPINSQSILDFHSPKAYAINVTCIDLTGKVVSQHSFEVDEGKNKIPVSEMLPTSAQPGIYFLNVHSAYGLQTFRLIKL